MREFKEQNILYKLMTLGLIAGLVFFVCSVIYSVIISMQYPRELLEPSNIALTRMFLEGKSPYTLKSLDYIIPAVNYEYPFLGSLLAAGIVLVSGCEIVTAHYIISTIAFLATGVVGYLLIKPYSKTLVAPIAGAILFMMCHWRFGFISAAPDDLGLFLFVLTLYFAVSPKIKNKSLICAIMTTLCFYTKQYLVFVALGIFVYELFYSKKEAVKFLISTIAINLVVIVIISIFWPLYWTYIFFFLYNGTFSGIGFGFESLLAQMKYLSAIFIGLFAVIVAAVIRGIIKRNKVKHQEESVVSEDNIDISAEKANAKKRRGIWGLINIKENDALSLFAIEIPVMFVPLIFFGRNDGAFLSYFLQLWMPSIIVVTFIVLEKMAAENDKLWFVILYGVITAFTVLFGYLKLPFHILTDEEASKWEEAYKVIEDYRENGDIYYASEFAYLAAENGDYTIFCGHDGEVSEVSLETWNNSKLCQKLFPYAADIIQKNIDFKNNLTRKAFYVQYSLVTSVDGYGLNFSEEFFDEVLPFYEKIDSMELQTGNMPYTVSFFKRIDDYEDWYIDDDVLGLGRLSTLK